VDFAMRLPVHLKLKRKFETLAHQEPNALSAFQKEPDGKVILRNMMSAYIPKDVVEQGKQGFSAPDASWFKKDSLEYVTQTLLNPQALIYHFMDRSVVKQLIDAHLSGQENKRLLIWSLLNVEKACGHWFK
jgi:asparagine synthase (glutamine-hydrolysing)